MLKMWHIDLYRKSEKKHCQFAEGMQQKNQSLHQLNQLTSRLNLNMLRNI